MEAEPKLSNTTLICPYTVQVFLDHLKEAFVWEATPHPPNRKALPAEFPQTHSVVTTLAPISP